MQGRRRDRRPFLGRLGEAWVCLFLIAHGYRVVARNLRTPVAEVDVVARRGRHLVLCEVKTRRGPGDVVVSRAQRERLRRAARWLLPRYAPRGGSLRLDLALVRVRRWWFPTLTYYRAALGDDEIAPY
ncbi:MAG: YraN family protein [Planctomycetota bacterium]